MKQEMILGVLLGRRQAYSTVAGRCSAAEVAHMKEIRDTKVYLEVCPDWQSFCLTHLHMSDDTANRHIRLLENYGTTYFDIAQLTRMSPAIYRAIAPAIQDDKLVHNGETLALIPENADKVAAAVAELKKTIPVRPSVPARAPEIPLEKRCADVVIQLKTEAAIRERRAEVRAMLSYLSANLVEIEKEL